MTGKNNIYLCHHCRAYKPLALMASSENLCLTCRKALRLEKLKENHHIPISSCSDYRCVERSDPLCVDCGRSGHYARYCPVKVANNLHEVQEENFAFRDYSKAMERLEDRKCLRQYQRNRDYWKIYLFYFEQTSNYIKYNTPLKHVSSLK